MFVVSRGMHGDGYHVVQSGQGSRRSGWSMKRAFAASVSVFALAAVSSHPIRLAAWHAAVPHARGR
jgi:hypothetical protein